MNLNQKIRLAALRLIGNNNAIKDAENAVIEATKPKVYRALLSQSGTNAPTATVLENTLGNIVWEYVSTGVYNGTLIGAFYINKTTPTDIAARLGSDIFNSVIGDYFSNDVYQIKTYVGTDLSEFANNILSNAYIEILVYP